MLAQTQIILRAAINADPSLTPADRADLLARMRDAPAPTEAPAGRLVKRAEAARLLSVTPRTISNMARQGILPRRILPGRTRGLGFALADVQRIVTGAPAAQA